MMKRTRRTVALVLSTILTLGCTVVIGSAVKKDPQLALAEKYAEQLFSYEAISKDKTETELKEDIEKLESLNKTIKAYDLMGLDGEADYVLVTRGVNGYAVFQKEDLELIEFSQYNTSPFGNLSDNPYVYYGGPTNYYRKQGEQVENIHTGKAFDKEVAAQIAPKLQTKIQQDKAERLERQEQERLQKEEQAIELASAIKSDLMINALSSGTGNSSEIIIGDPGPTGGDEIDADELTVVSRQYIDDKEYFIYLENHADNVEGTCSSVAVTLLLGYLNWKKDGRLITHPDFLFQDENKTRADWLETPYAHETMSPTYIPQPPGMQTLVDQTGTFYGVILDYVNPVQVQGEGDELVRPGADVDKEAAGINEYLLEYVDQEVRECVDVNYYEDQLIAKAAILEGIENDYPLIASIDTFELQEGTEIYEKRAHSVVIYGIQTIRYNGEIIDGYIAHYGWGATHTHNWVNDAWVNKSLSITTSHVHSGEMPYRNNSHVLQCAVCQRTRTTSVHTAISWELKKLGENEGVGNNDNDPIYHYDCCYCGYKTVDFHRFGYLPLSSINHRKICLECGYEEPGYHVQKPGTTYCALCGQLGCEFALNTDEQVLATE